MTDQKAAAEKIYAFYKKRRRMPSYAEIAALLGFRSKDSAFRLVAELLSARMIMKDREGKLVPVYRFAAESSHIRLLGLIEAGFPSPAEESLLDTVSIDEWLVPNKESSFMLKVKGDSMVDAGICNGDMVIAERANDAKVGSIVIAELDGEWTLKYLQKDSKGYYLQPANRDFPPVMRPEKNLSIAAVVRGVIRRY